MSPVECVAIVFAVTVMALRVIVFFPRSDKSDDATNA